MVLLQYNNITSLGLVVFHVQCSACFVPECNLCQHSQQYLIMASTKYIPFLVLEVRFLGATIIYIVPFAIIIGWECQSRH